MKVDMAGSAAVIQAIGAVAALEAPVVCTRCGGDRDMPSGKSYKLGDVLTRSKDLEINTPTPRAVSRSRRARLAKTLQPTRSSTSALTGACMVALAAHCGRHVERPAAL